MKQVFSALSVLFLFLLLTGCAQKSYLHSQVDKFNETECPYQMGDNTTLQRIEMHENTVVFFIDEDEDISEATGLRESALYYFASVEDENIKEIIDEMINEGIALGLSYKDQNDQIFKFEYSAYELDLKRMELEKEDNSELAIDDDDDSYDSYEESAGNSAAGFSENSFTIDDISNMSASSADIYLRQGVKIAKSNLPSRVDDDLTFTDIRVNDDELIYVYNCNEQNYDISTIRIIQSEIKENMKSEMLADDDTKVFVALTAKTGRNLIYRYVGSVSGDRCDITFTSSELKSMINVY